MSRSPNQKGLSAIDVIIGMTGLGQRIYVLHRLALLYFWDRRRYGDSAAVFLNEMQQSKFNVENT
jgi:hypothetical protein